MTKDEALRLALEALEVANSLVDGYYLPKEKAWMPEIEEAITAIKAALEAKDEQISIKQMIKLKTVDEPCNQVMALGQMMRDWLQSQIADSNTSVDVGKGFSEFDLWVQCEGKELFITIKEKND